MPNGKVDERDVVMALEYPKIYAIRPRSRFHDSLSLMVTMPPALLPDELYTRDAVRAMDHFAIHRQGIPGIDLMERAGAAAFEAIRQHWPKARTLSVICGTGNNGGDGYIVARLAHEQGWDVRVFPAANTDSLKGDANAACLRYRDAGGALLDFMPEDFEGAEVLVDALLGTGLDRIVSGSQADIIQAINRYRTRDLQGRVVVAIDIPSGLNADTGAIMGHAVKADLTVTFVGVKRGLLTGEGPELTGKIQFDSLGIDTSGYHGIQPSARRLPDPRSWLPQRPRSAHKGHHGHVLVIGGDQGFSGAARLAAQAALKVGAGRVSIATRVAHAASLNQGCPELMCHPVESETDLAPLLAGASVIALGPGLGTQGWGRMMFHSTLKAERPLIVDADALNLLSEYPDQRKDWVLTPHPGEAGRLLGCTAEAIQRDRFAALSALQNRFGGTLVLKGSGSLILHERSTPWICPLGNPGMASGGMGDVLTGIIAGLAAQKIGLAQSARLGVWLHAAAGDLAARDGERGLLASDLFGPLRTLVNGLETPS